MEDIYIKNEIGWILKKIISAKFIRLGRKYFEIWDYVEIWDKNNMLKIKDVNEKWKEFLSSMFDFFV